jgi:hypothetical protein
MKKSKINGGALAFVLLAFLLSHFASELRVFEWRCASLGGARIEGAHVSSDYY